MSQNNTNPVNNYHMHLFNGSYECMEKRSNNKPMTNDIVTFLLPFIHDEVRIPAGLIMDTIDEIERLRRALDLAVGELSTNDRYRIWNPEQLRQQLLDEAVRGE